MCDFYEALIPAHLGSAGSAPPSAEFFSVWQWSSNAIKIALPPAGGSMRTEAGPVLLQRGPGTPMLGWANFDDDDDDDG